MVNTEMRQNFEPGIECPAIIKDQVLIEPRALAELISRGIPYIDPAVYVHGLLKALIAISLRYENGNYPHISSPLSVLDKFKSGKLPIDSETLATMEAISNILPQIHKIAINHRQQDIDIYGSFPSYK